MSSIGCVATRSSRWLTKYRYAVALDTPACAAAASTVGVVPAASSVRAASIIADRKRAGSESLYSWPWQHTPRLVLSYLANPSREHDRIALRLRLARPAG